MGEPVWITDKLVVAIHDRQLAEHGGSPGLRDRGLLESALARPQHLFAYGGPDVDLPALAAAYTFGLARNHPFVDGNKRTAYVVCRTFMALNDWNMVGPLADRYPIFLGVAEGTVGEEELAVWLREHTRPRQVSEPRAHYHGRQGPVRCE